ncbi:hypothetical protein AK812_SmicGene46544, partial [Symbiodinium microadriaticum]
DLHAASGASEPAGTAEVAAQALQDMVSQQLEWLQAVVAGRITLQRAEEVLNMRSSLVELLLLYK